MSNCDKQFLDYEGLRQYDRKIKEYIGEGEAASERSVKELKDQISGLEDEINSISENTNTAITIATNIANYIDGGGAIISGGTMMVDKFPTYGNTDKLVSSDGVFRGINGKTGYAVCDTVSGSTFGVTIDGYNGGTHGEGGSMTIKMMHPVTTESAYLAIASEGVGSGYTVYTHQIYFNDKPASSENTWAAGTQLRVWFDGQNYQTTNAINTADSAFGKKVDRITVNQTFPLAEQPVFPPGASRRIGTVRFYTPTGSIPTTTFGTPVLDDLGIVGNVQKIYKYIGVGPEQYDFLPQDEPTVKVGYTVKLENPEYSGSAALPVGAYDGDIFRWNGTYWENIGQ